MRDKKENPKGSALGSSKNSGTATNIPRLSQEKKLVKRFAKLFAGRTDAFIKLEGGSYSTISQPLLISHYEAHLLGKSSLAIFPILDNGTCKWACVDFDCKDESHPVKSAEKCARKFAKNLSVLGIKSFPEKSKSGRIHLWSFFKEPVKARDIRKFLFFVSNQMKLTIKSGNVEIFPKQDDLNDAKVGNAVNLPYFDGLNGKGKRRIMLYPNTFKPIKLSTFLDRAEKNLIPLRKFKKALTHLPGEQKVISINNQRSNIDLEKLKEVLSRYWNEGQRQDLSLFLSGYLAKQGWEWDEVKSLILEIATSCRDKELPMRMAAIKATFEKSRKGEELKGFEGLKEILDPEDLKAISNIFSSNGSGSIQVVEIAKQSEPSAMRFILQDAIPYGFPIIIYGGGGLGKSYLGLYFATLAAIGGETFLGLQFCKKPVKVLYLDWELDLNELTRRAYRIARGLGLARPPSGLLYWQPDDILENVLPELKLFIPNHGIELLIIDSLGVASVNPEDVIEVKRLFTKLKNLGISTLIIDHQAKTQAKDRYDLKTPYGSIYKYNLSRSVFQLSVVKNSPGSLMLNHKKSNFGRLLHDLIFDVVFDTDKVKFLDSKTLSIEMRDIHLIYNTITKIEAEGKNPIQKLIIERLKGILSKDRILKLLAKYENKHWIMDKGDLKNANIYKSKKLQKEETKIKMKSISQNTEEKKERVNQIR